MDCAQWWIAVLTGLTEVAKISRNRLANRVPGNTKDVLASDQVMAKENACIFRRRNLPGAVSCRRSPIASRVSPDIGGKSGSCKVMPSCPSSERLNIGMRLAAGFRTRHHYVPGSDVGHT